MNKVILMGRLTRDPEVRYSAGNNSMAVARYTLQLTADSAAMARTMPILLAVSLSAKAQSLQKNISVRVLRLL